MDSALSSVEETIYSVKETTDVLLQRLDVHTAGYTVLAVVCLLGLIRYISKTKYLSSVPVPPGASWIWGHEKVVFMSDAGTAYTKWFKEMGSYVIRIKAGLMSPDILVVSDPGATTYIMAKNIYNYQRSEVVRPRITRLFGKSLGWVEEESEHKRMRYLITPAFSVEVIRANAQGVFDAAENLRVNLEKTLQSASTSEKQTVVNIHAWAGGASLGVIGRFGFGNDFGGGSSPAARHILDTWRKMAMVAMSNKGFVMLMLLRRFRLMNSIPLKSVSAQSDVRLAIHASVAKEMLGRDKKNLDALGDSSAGNDLLSRLAKAYREHKIPREELMDHISTIIMAGSETTSQTLARGVWELGRNPKIQDRLREEVQRFPDEPTYDQFHSEMPYLDAVIRETIRLWPAAPYMERCARNDDVIPLRHPIVDKNGKVHSEIHIKAGQTIVTPIFSLNRLDSIWGDGAVFRPERWMGPLPPQDTLPHGWGNTLSFSEGPRNCPGFRLAFFELKVIIAMLVRNFKFADTGVAIRTKTASSMNPLVAGEEDLGPNLPVKVMKL